MEINQKKLWDFVQNNMEQSRILVVGDVMLDKYYFMAMSRVYRRRHTSCPSHM